MATIVVTEREGEKMRNKKIIAVFLIAIMLMGAFVPTMANAKKSKAFSIKKDIKIHKVIHYTKSKKLTVEYTLKKTLKKKEYCSFWTDMTGDPYWLFDTKKKKGKYTKTLKLSKKQHKDIGSEILAHDQDGRTKYPKVTKKNK